MPIITKKYLSLQNLLYSGNFSQVRKIAKFLSFALMYFREFPIRKLPEFCQINFCEYRSFISRKTFIVLYCICRNIGLQHAQLLQMTKSKKITRINFRVLAKFFVLQGKLLKIAQISGNLRQFLLQKF